ncbi:metal-sulfur cluster assembly factor [Propionicicella superfundia]|uniref:metal-sulfur cluster assembly factor n=1 Tax=Propionicicella superfundia TaxID=348582 RepID=UPI0004220356|nr:metal-sulfur cluster assembly factor [Propionicicella superfundia]
MTETPRPSDLVADDLPEVDLTGRITEDQVLEAMKDVIDPELGVNVVDLGLVYGVDVDDQNNLTLDMTLTMPTCPLYDYIEQQVEVVLAPMVTSTAVNWVMEPMWSPHNITEDGREQLRAMGYNV